MWFFFNCRPYIIHLQWNLVRTSNQKKTLGGLSRLFLTTSLDNIIDSFHHTHSQLIDMTEYRDRMREFYSTGPGKDKIKYLNITKVNIYSMFIDPKTRANHPFPRRVVCAWIGAIFNDGKIIQWRGSSWYLINLSAI